MAKARQAKADKAKARQATTTPGHPAPRAATPRASATQTPDETKTILLKLQGMFVPSSHPYQLCSDAIRHLEARAGGVSRETDSDRDSK